MKIGVLMIHKPCGHSGYHIVDQRRDSREVYDKMAEQLCPDCLKGKPHLSQKEQVITEIQKAVKKAVMSEPDILTPVRVKLRMSTRRRK